MPHVLFRRHVRLFAFAIAVAPVGCAGVEPDETAGGAFTDSFATGEAELSWLPFEPFYGDVVEAKVAADAPDGDGGIGVLRNDTAGGFAALSYADTPPAATFDLEASVYCPPAAEAYPDSLTGLAFLVDPEQAAFYRFVCDYSTDEPSLSLGYVGRDTNNYPVYLGRWPLAGDEGGDGWNRMTVSVDEEGIAVGWNGNRLNRAPIPADRVSRGHAGAYANHTGGLGTAEARIDAFSFAPR